MVLGTVVAGAAEKAWDDSPAGQDGALARAARSVAAVSVKVPVVVLVDDIDLLGRDLAQVLADNLVTRPDGQVLLVATTIPAAADGCRPNLRKDLASRHWLTGRVHRSDADPDMSYQSRADLVAELCPALRSAAVRRIARRTTNFAEVFAVTSARRLRDAEDYEDDEAALAVADAVIDAAEASKPVSLLAAILTWAGGVIHAMQADAALAVIPGDHHVPDPDVIRTATLVRLADPISVRLKVAVNALSADDRQQMAHALLVTAQTLTTDPHVGLIDRIVSAQAVRRVGGDLTDPGQLLVVEVALVAGLEELGDLEAAFHVAAEAIAGSTPGRNHNERRNLSAAVLRLASKLPARREDPLVRDLIVAAAAGGAAIGLESRLWAAVDLLGIPGKREVAMALANEVAAEISAREDLGPLAPAWRRLLAFHAGKAGYTSLAQRLLASEITAGSREREDAAQAILYAIGGSGADTRLQIVCCEAELAGTPDIGEDDRLRLHATLAAGYGSIGSNSQALQHALHELPLRYRLQGPDHRDTLTTRANIAGWTGYCGDPAGAVRLFQELLPDRVRILGPDHPSTLATHANIGVWTGQDGDLAGAQRLFQELLPDLIRVLGPDHPDTLIARMHIADLFGQRGDRTGALRLFQELLPDITQVLGPDAPVTMITRGDLATWTGYCTGPAEARRLLQELLPDEVRVLGADHPDTVATRGNLAYWTGRAGDPAGALAIYRELLPDIVRLTGPDHPGTLGMRDNIANYTGHCGDQAGAVRQYRELVRDKIRVLGPDHPSTLITRGNLAYWIGEEGDLNGARRLNQELLPDMIRVLGPDHPDTLNIRAAISN